jgi:hypothetical protein
MPLASSGQNVSFTYRFVDGCFLNSGELSNHSPTLFRLGAARYQTRCLAAFASPVLAEGTIGYTRPLHPRHVALVNFSHKLLVTPVQGTQKGRLCAVKCAKASLLKQ